MRLVAYVRVSSKAQLDGWGLADQRKQIRSWAKANGHTIIAEFADEAVTGKLPAADRPGLTEALRLLRRPPHADGIICRDPTRLARELHVQEAVFALVWREGGHVFTVDHGEWERDDPADPYRTAFRQMAGVFAQLERATIVKRLRDGIQAKAAAGRKATGSYAYGYEATGTGRERDAGPRADEQRAVARIVELRAAGETFRAIAATLDREGLHPRRAAAWSAAAVRNVALRESAG